MFENMFNGIMGKIKNGMCRLSMNGGIAVKTSDGYKVYNPKNGNLTNCSNFVLDIADDFFFVMPTRNLKSGDIVLIKGKPMYILDVKAKNRVEAMSYEDSTIQTVIPERHAFFGRRFYGKIVSMIGGGFGSKGGFFKNMLKLKMMSSMLGGGSIGAAVCDGTFGGSALPMMMLLGGGSMDNLFNGLVDDEDDEDDEDDGDDDAGNFLNGIFNDGAEDVDEEDTAETSVKPMKKPSNDAAKKAVRKTPSKKA